MGYKLKRIMMRPNGVEKQVRPSGGGGWQPTAHTLLYIPMDSVSGTTDQSQYQRTYTTTGLTHTTFGGVDCYRIYNGYIDLGTSATSWLIPSSNEFTALFWVYCNTAIGGYNQYILLYNGAVYNEYCVSLGWMPIAWNNYTTGTVLGGGAPQGGQEWGIQGTCGTQAWHLVSFTIKNGVNTLYKDGVKDADTTNVGYTLPNNGFGIWGTSAEQGIKIGSSRNGNDRLDGYLGQIVMEDVGRTDQQIADYYNQTKANYGY